MTTGDRVYWMAGMLRSGRLICSHAGMACIGEGTNTVRNVVFVPEHMLHTSSSAALQSVEPSPSVIVDDTPVPAPTSWTRSPSQCEHTSTRLLEGESGWTCTVCGHMEYFA